MREAWAWPESQGATQWGQAGDPREGADIITIQVRHTWHIAHMDEANTDTILIPTARRHDGWAVILTTSRQTNNYSGGCHCLVILNPGHHYPPLHKSPAGWLIVPPWPGCVQCPQSRPPSLSWPLSLSAPEAASPRLLLTSHRARPIVTPEAGHPPHGGPGAGGHRADERTGETSPLWKLWSGSRHHWFTLEIMPSH